MSVKEPTIEKENTVIKEVTDDSTFKPSKARNSNYSVGELFGLFIMMILLSFSAKSWTRANDRSVDFYILQCLTHNACEIFDNIFS